MKHARKTLSPTFVTKAFVEEGETLHALPLDEAPDPSPPPGPVRDGPEPAAPLLELREERDERAQAARARGVAVGVRASARVELLVEEVELPASRLDADVER